MGVHGVRAVEASCHGLAHGERISDKEAAEAWAGYEARARALGQLRQRTKLERGLREARDWLRLRRQG